MSLATLFGKLQEHEMELMRLNQHEENDKNKKGVKGSPSRRPFSGKTSSTRLSLTRTEIEEDCKQSHIHCMHIAQRPF